MRQFAGWLAGRGIDPMSVTPAVTTAWVADLASGSATGSPLGRASQARKLSAVLGFYRYARAEGLTSADPTPLHRPKVHRAPVTGLSEAQARRVWAATAGHPRDRLLVALLMLCGLRVGEALHLDLADVGETAGERTVSVMGKGSKPRLAVLPAPAVQALREYLAVHGDQPGPLLSTRKGTRIDSRAAERMIARIGRDADVAGLHPHQLRHTAATTAIDAGVSVMAVADMLGHASVSTTMHYVKGRDRIRNTPVHAVAARLTT